jgi:NAD(P)-dependent dehydrogenase (short-subunit alcohol dehydrogenase family)
MRLTNMRVMVTGAAEGVGFAIAKAFATAGARVFLFDVNGEKLAAAVRTLRSAELHADYFVGSVAQTSDVDAAFARMDCVLGGIDALINNAGISSNRPTQHLSDEEWDRPMAVNLRGSFLCSRAAGVRMLAQGSGCIVSISSIYGITAAPERLAYCVSKAGVAMMAKALAIEWAAQGVRSNAIAPGYVQTRLVDDLVARGRIDLAELQRRTPLARFALPEEIAEMAVFLCSPAAAYITGQVIGVDGGWTAYGYI